MVGGGNPILLRLTGPVAQFIRPCAVVHGEAGFKRSACHNAQVGVRHRKVRVEFDGMFEERRRRFRSFCPESLHAGAVSFQGFKRGCRRLLQGGIKLLDRTQRLAQLIPHLDGHVSKCIEHMVLVARLCLRTRQRFSTSAVDRLERQKVLGANPGNRTIEYCGALRPLADLSCNCRY